MSINKTMSDAMLGTFRTMARECVDRGLSGTHVEQMNATLARMEQLAEECTDLNQFNAQLMGEDLFNKFSQHYGAALAGEAQQAQGDNAYDDAALLKQSLDAYRDAIKRLKEVKAHAMSIADDTHEIDVLLQQQKVIEPIEKVISIGESGVNYPTFLRMCIETGADRAMEGSIVMREGLEYILGWAKASMLSAPELTMNTEIISMYDNMVATAPFGVPDPFQFKLERQKVEHRHAPAVLRWDAIRRHWERLLSSMDHWIVSYCPFAPFIEPWSLAKDPQRAVRKSQEVTPGQFKVREAIFNRYFGLTWDDIFSHETFINEVKAHRIGYAQQWVDLLKRTYVTCKPAGRPADDCIRDAENWYKTQWGDPESHLGARRLADYYDSVFGAGRFVAKHGAITPSTSQAPPWNLEG